MGYTSHGGPDVVQQSAQNAQLRQQSAGAREPSAMSKWMWEQSDSQTAVSSDAKVHGRQCSVQPQLCLPLQDTNRGSSMLLTVRGGCSASGVEHMYPEAVPVCLGTLPDHFATTMATAWVNAPVPLNRPDGGANDSNNNDNRLPMYKCACCDNAVVLSGGGVLECSECWS